MSTTDRSLEPLMALLGQAERERDAALADAQRAQAQQQAAQLQSEQLIAYRLDYEHRFRERCKQHQGIDVILGYQGFLERLNLAIDQQDKVLAYANTRLERARDVVREQEMRVASVRKLLERRLQELQQAAGRREQKQSDEFATRAAWNQLASQTVSPAL